MQNPASIGISDSVELSVDLSVFVTAIFTRISVIDWAPFSPKLAEALVFVYFKTMKFLILILVLAISAQPLQAGFCDMDMEQNQETSHHIDQMDHSGQDKHDCCDSDGSDSQEGCDSEMKCGFCFANAVALPSMIKFNTSWFHQYSRNLTSGLVVPSHSSPLFRPPIS